MMTRVCFRLAASLLAAVTSFTATGQLAFADNVTVPPVPTDIQAPEGTTAFFEGHAAGTQDYICLPSPNGFAWTFFAPQATLFTSFKLFQREIRQQIITHFLSPNPVEQGVSRVTWQSSLDSSAVWAKALKSSVDPAFVAPDSIPWVLLTVVGSQPGPVGGAALTPTLFIQRINTHGGIAPSTGCSQSTDVGATALSPYTADYIFYKKSGLN